MTFEHETESPAWAGIAKAAKIFELLLYLVGCCFGGYRAAQEITIAQRESKPTPYTAEEFPRLYTGQQWIEVTGKLALKHKSARVSTHQAHQGKHLSYVTVPVVPDSWKRDDEVHVLATYGPMPTNSVNGWADRHRDKKVTAKGQLRPGGFADPKRFFPTLNVSESYVVINTGTAPKHLPSMIGFLALMTVCTLLFFKRIRNLMRGAPVEF